MKVYSLAKVAGTLQNDNYGNVNVGAISLGGGGKLVDTIQYRFNSDMFSLSCSPDGGAAVAHNNDRSGSISFSIKQTSPHIPILSEYFKWCWDHPEQAEATLVIRDETGNIAFQANGVYPSRFPGNSVSGNVGDRTFEFTAAQIIPQESDF